MAVTELDRPQQTTPRATGPQAGRVRGRVSPGHLLMVVAALLAGLLNYGLLRSGDDRVPVSMAATDLPAGHALTPGDLTTAGVASDDAVVATLLTPEAATSGDLVITRPLRRGDLLRRSDVTSPSADRLRAMSLPIEIAHAAGGALGPGDVVDVISVRDGRAAYELTAVEVLAVDRDGGPALTGGAGLTLTLAVDDRSALRLAAAMAAGGLEIVRATGSPKPEAEAYQLPTSTSTTAHAEGPHPSPDAGTRP